MRPALVVLLLSALLTALYWAGADAGARAERALQAIHRQPQAGARTELEAVLGVPNARARALQLAEYFDRASPADLDATWQAYQSAEAYVDALALVLLADWWASFDPAGAFAHSLNWRFRDADAARFTIMRSWARQEPAAARRFTDENRNRANPNSDVLIQALVVGWAERGDASDVWLYVEQLSAGVERQRAVLALIARSFAANGVEETLRSVDAIPDDGRNQFKRYAYRRTAWALARFDPERAKQWVVERIDGPYGGGILRLVGGSLAVSDGAGALEWLQTFQPGEERDEAVLETFRAWLRHDRELAIAWLRDAAPNTALEPALVQLVSATAQTDPAQAQAILERIEDPGLREAAYVYLVRSWMTHDRDAALAWFETAPVSEEARRHVVEERPGILTPRRSQPSPAPAGSSGGSASEPERARLHPTPLHLARGA
jgi:hypothetical protein